MLLCSCFSINSSVRNLYTVCFARICTFGHHSTCVSAAQHIGQNVHASSSPFQDATANHPAGQRKHGYPYTPYVFSETQHRKQNTTTKPQLNKHKNKNKKPNTTYTQTKQNTKQQTLRITTKTKTTTTQHSRNHQHKKKQNKNTKHIHTNIAHKRKHTTTT